MKRTPTSAEIEMVRASLNAAGRSMQQAAESGNWTVEIEPRNPNIFRRLKKAIKDRVAAW